MESTENTRFIGSIISFCSKASVDLLGAPRDALRVIVVLCMKFIDRKQLLDGLMPDKYVDWEFVANNVSRAAGDKNPIGDTGTWMTLMEYMDFGSIPMNETILKNTYPPLWCIYNSLKHTGVLRTETNKQKAADAGIKQMTYDDACKLTILNNVCGLQSRTVTERYTSVRLQVCDLND